MEAVYRKYSLNELIYVDSESTSYTNGGNKMLETIVIVVCAIVCIGVAGFAWWMENAPEKDANIKDDIKIHEEK